jgi:hypothetical protein
LKDHIADLVAHAMKGAAGGRSTSYALMALNASDDSGRG